MSAWTLGALSATLALALCGVAIVRGTISARLVGLQLAGTVAAVDMLLIAQSFGNASVMDAALMLAILSYPAGLIYARFYGRSP